MTIIENQKNTDHNGVEMFIGEIKGSYSVDMTGNGDYLKFEEYSNEVWVVTDDLSSNYTHFTEDIKATIEAYIEEEENEENIAELRKILEKL